MPKQPSKPGQKFSASRPFASTGARPTVALPGVAAGVGPTAAARVNTRPTPDEITHALQVAAAYFSQKQLKQAELVADKILEFQPKQPDALHLKGLVAFETGHPDKAEHLIASAVKEAGKTAGGPTANMLVNFGNAFREQGKFDQALAIYERALKLKPEYVDAFLERAVLKIYNRQPEAALADLDHAIALKPDFVLAYARAVEAQMDAGKFREALAYCEKAIEMILSPPAVIFALKANIHDRLSDLDQAIAEAERAMAIDAYHPEAIRVWARAQRRRGADEAILAEARRRLKSLDTSALPFDQARSVHEELAQICEETGDADEAFVEFGRMNKVAAREAAAAKVDRHAYLTEVERLTGVTTAESVSMWSELPPVKPESALRGPPVFLVGFPRSGTTLLEQVLDAHPDLQAIEERPLLHRMRTAADAFENGYPKSIQSITADQRSTLREVYRKALAEEGGDPAHRLVVDKMPLNLIHAGLIARVFPEAKIILALRHPADCVLSCFMQNFRLNASMANFLTIEDAAHLYDRVMTLWQTARALLPLNVVEVRYENLVRDLRGEVEPVLDFLGLPWNEAQADPAAHAKARGTIRTPSYAQVTQPIYSSAADRWRRYEKHLAPVLPVLEKHIRHFGYAL